jgi:Holliday junction resolvase
MPINSRSKGARFERDLADQLRQLGFEARRGIQFRGGEDSPDVISDFPLHIEAKHVEKLNLYSAIEQSKRDSGGNPYCVIHKRNRGETFVTLELSQLVEIIRK